MRGIRLEDRILMGGLTGKGKTTLAEWIVGLLQPVRLIVFDPKDELHFPGVEKARSPAELALAMHQPIVHYVPSGFDQDTLEEACQIVWETPGPYVWWIDELAEVSRPGYCPTGLRLAMTQGRSKKKLVLVLCQRFHEIHPVFRSQAEHVFIFVPPPIELDLKAIAGAVPREASLLEEELKSLHAEHGDFSHLWYVRSTDELRRMAPVDPGEPLAAPADPGDPGDPPEDTGQQEGTATAPEPEGSQSPT